MSKKILYIYKTTISKIFEYLFGRGCIFEPTCSQYFLEAVDRYGIVKGGVMTTRRIIRCHPFYKGRLYDPIK